MYGLGKSPRAVKVCEWRIEIMYSVSRLCVQWNRNAPGFFFKSVCEALLHWLGALGQEVCVVKTEDSPSFG